MKIYSWNINGIRSTENKLIEFINVERPDILMLQEIRARPDQVSFFLKCIENYNYIFNDSGKPGYSGTGLYYRNNLDLKFKQDLLKDSILSKEGRSICFDYEDVTYLNIYTPNGNSSEERFNFKLAYYKELKEFATSMYKNNKKVVIGGDFNVAHTAIDLYSPKASRNSGFLQVERDWLSDFIANGFIDSFRKFNDQPNNYTWWHMRDPSREKNKGWRYDYFIVSANMETHITNASILRDVFGSDHCPIMIEINDLV